MPHSFLKGLIRNLKNTSWRKILTLTQQTAFLNFLENLTNGVQENFKEIIGEDTDKKRFLKSLARIFTLLLNTKVDRADKIKRILKIAVETTLKI